MQKSEAVRIPRCDATSDRAYGCAYRLCPPAARSALEPRVNASTRVFIRALNCAAWKGIALSIRRGLPYQRPGVAGPASKLLKLAGSVIDVATSSTQARIICISFRGPPIECRAIGLVEGRAFPEPFDEVGICKRPPADRQHVRQA
jgi:hypothetical protein